MEVTTVIDVENDPESMLARMLTPAHAAPDEGAPPLTLDQLRGALQGSPSEPRPQPPPAHAHAPGQLPGAPAARSPADLRTSLVLEQLRGALAARSPHSPRSPLSPRSPHSPRSPRSMRARTAAPLSPRRSSDVPMPSVLPMDQADQTENGCFETLQQKDVLRTSPVDVDCSFQNFHQDQDASTAMDSEAGGGASARVLAQAQAPAADGEAGAGAGAVHSELNNWETSTTVTKNDQRVASVQHSGLMEALEITEVKPELKLRLLKQNNGYHVSEKSAVGSPAPARARAASVVPDVSITPLPAPAHAPRAASAPAPAGTVPTSTPRARASTPDTNVPDTPVSVAADDDDFDSLYDDNRLLVEVQNPESKGAKHKNGRRPRLPAPPGSLRGASSRHRECSGLNPASAELLRGRKRGLLRLLRSILREEHGKDVGDEEVEALLVGPEHIAETLSEADVLGEFVQIAVTTVFEPVPCTALLRAALPARTRAGAGAYAAPASFFLHVTKEAAVSSVSVQHAACTPGACALGAGGAPFQHHEFRGGSPAAALEAASERAAPAHGARMREARAALARAADRLARQLQVVRQLTLATCEAGQAGQQAGRAGRTGRAGLAARLPARSLADFQQLDDDLRASAELRGELMAEYRALCGAARTSWDVVRGALERTLAAPVDAHYSGSGRCYRGVQKADYSATVPYACLRDVMEQKFGATENLDNLRSRVGQWLCGKQDRPAVASAP